MSRVGAIDIGTNTTRLLVGDVADGRVDELVRRSAVTRLGEGVDARRLLLPASIERVHTVLAGFRRELDELGAEHTLAVATSAVRDAENGAAFLDEIGAQYGFATRLLSGEEEAALTRRGVGAVDEGTLVLDVGGGSTELILGEFRVSLDVGSVRLTERYLKTDPPARDELETAARFVDSLLPELEVTAAVGVAGSVAQLSALVGELTADAVEAELDLLASLPLDERRLLPNLDPGRAPVIVAGALIIARILRRYRLSALSYSVRDLLDGVALEAARPPEES